MSTLTLGQARALVETDLNDLGLQLLIDDIESEITRRIGATASQVDTFVSEAIDEVLHLSRNASSITSVVEKIKSNGAYESTTLSSDDYELRSNGLILERLSDGTNPRTEWGHKVVVTYVPVSDANERLSVTVEVLKLAIAFNGVKSESIGDYSSMIDDYRETRAKIINRLRPSL